MPPRTFRGLRFDESFRGEAYDESFSSRSAQTYVGPHDDLPAGQRRGRRGPSGPGFNYVNLLLLAYDNGTIAFHDAAGEVVAAVDTGHAGGVAAVAVDGAEEPVLATAGAGGEVQFYNLTLWQDDAVVAGRRPRPRPRARDCLI